MSEKLEVNSLQGELAIIDNAGHVRILENVLHVPKLKNRVMSLTQLAIKT